MDIKTYTTTLISGWSKPTIDPKGFDELGYKTPIRAQEYLAFAEKDLRLGGVRGFVNALSNAKRAIDCEVSNLLTAIGLHTGGNFPSKLEKLQALGLVAPRIVRKVVQLRNRLEHDYHRPTQVEVEDAVDIATLFLDTLKPFVSGGAYMSSCWLADEPSANQWPIVRRNGITSWEDKKKPKYTFSRGIYIDSDLESHTVNFLLVHENKELGDHQLGPKHPLYLEVQAFLIKCRPENHQCHSKRGALELIRLLHRWE